MRNVLLQNTNKRFGVCKSFNIFESLMLIKAVFILLQLLILSFPCDGKAQFSASLLQSSISHDS